MQSRPIESTKVETTMKHVIITTVIVSAIAVFSAVFHLEAIRKVLLA